MQARFKLNGYLAWNESKKNQSKLLYSFLSYKKRVCKYLKDRC